MIRVVKDAGGQFLPGADRRLLRKAGFLQEDGLARHHLAHLQYHEL